MNVAGLSNLGFQQPVASAGRADNKSAAKPSQKDGEKSSFAKVLGKREERSSQAPRAQESSTQSSKREPGENSKHSENNDRDSRDQTVNQRQSDSDVQADDMGPGIPSGQALSGFQGSMEPRAMNPQVNPQIAANLSRPATGPTPEEQANSLTRRVVWSDFLRKMNDLGVSAEDVLKAFGSLTKEELAQPAKKSIDKLVMALGLDGQQAQLAKQYFSDLIQKTKSKSIGEELAASQKQVSLTLLTQAEMEKRKLSRSLDDMNNRFFVNEMAMRAKQQQQAGSQQLEQPMMPSRLDLARQAQAEMTPFEQQDEENRLDVLAPPLAPPGMGHPMPMAGGTAGAAALNPNNPQIQQLAAQMETLPPADRKMIAEMIHVARRAQLDPRLNAQDIGAIPAPGMDAGTGIMMRPGQAVAPAALPVSDIFGSDKNNSDSGSDDANTDDGSNMAALNGLTAVDHRNLQTGHTDFQSQLQQVSPQQVQPQMGVPDLVQQAQVMVKDGGGEMKVTLHPEGLGEIAMRVSVENGKVNVQMITQSDEAKHLLEHQLGDLKAGLAQNHLQVDSIKVDTAANLGRQMDQQYQDAQRQATHLAWEQFRQDNQGWRRSFFEGGAVNPYSSQISAPRDAGVPASAQARSKSVGSRRLDLVA